MHYLLFTSRIRLNLFISFFHSLHILQIDNFNIWIRFLPQYLFKCSVYLTFNLFYISYSCIIRLLLCYFNTSKFCFALNSIKFYILLFLYYYITIVFHKFNTKYICYVLMFQFSLICISIYNYRTTIY